MDANGTRYHLLLGCDDWGRCIYAPPNLSLADSWKAPGNPANFTWDSEHRQLTLEPLIYLYMASQGDKPPKIEHRRGAARDRYGNWYWIDDSCKRIRVLSAGSRRASDFWAPEMADASCAPEPDTVFQPAALPKRSEPLSYSGLVVTEGHYLITGVLEPAGLLIFDLMGGGSPQHFNWPEDVPFVPWDMAPMPGGGLWILDRENKRYWALDRNLNVIPADQQVLPPASAENEIFQPQGEHEEARKRPQKHFPQGIKLTSAVDLAVASGPISIAALPDCTVLILDQAPGNFSFISRYYFGRRLGEPVSTEIVKDYVEEKARDKFTLVAHDFAFVGEHNDGTEHFDDRLYIVSQNGNQTFAFTIEGTDAKEVDARLTLKPLGEEYLPMRLYTGKALVCAGTDAYYDMGERWIPLVRQVRPRYANEATFTQKFDGKQPGCAWNRLLMDACIPTDTDILIWSRAADEDRLLGMAPWQLERTYHRGDGSELPFAPDPFAPKPLETGLPSITTTGAKSGAEGAGTWELLFQNATGRYLELRVSFRGQGQRTPRLRAMRIYYPRFSYLEKYLPAVYRQDELSASFLDRYLANTEGTLTALEDKIAGVRMLFDVRSTPPEALEWLANWFGVALDPGWDEFRRRLFIHNAMLFFQYRGTVLGLRMALRLALDKCPGQHIFDDTACCDSWTAGSIRIIEAFRTRRFPGVFVGDPSQLEGSLETFTSGIWYPAFGANDLHNRYKQAAGGGDPYPIFDPGGNKSTQWKYFSKQTLGFIPAMQKDDLLLWQAYLLKTYGAVNLYNAAWSDEVETFDDIILPEKLPGDGSPLNDWYRFEVSYLPLVRNAHHFSVLLPVPVSTGSDTEEYGRRLVIAQRVLELEKPAHTTYDIRFFWSMFRVGEARLGLDTLLDLGSRSPNFMPPSVLGQAYLAQTYLAPEHGGEFSDRIEAGGGCRTFVSGVAIASTAMIRKETVSPARRSGCVRRER